MNVILAAGKGPLSVHLWHIVALAAWAPIFGLFLLFEQGKARRRARQYARPPDTTPSRERSLTDASGASGGNAWLQAMALAFVGAALVHVAVAPDHFRESGLYGGFFVAAALSQIGFAVCVLFRPSRRLVMAGILASTVMVVLWLYTRTVGVPVGPDNGATEEFGVLDILASTYEAAAVFLGVVAVRRLSGAPAWRWSKWAPALRLAAPCFLVATVAASLLASRS
jgi:hypothetical protein